MSYILIEIKSKGCFSRGQTHGQTSSQDYATIPDKEPEEGLYNTADRVPPQEADIQATLSTADYASIVELSLIHI